MKVLFKLLLSFLFFALSSQAQSIFPKAAGLNVDTSDLSSFHFFDSLAHQKKIFFLGENHEFLKSNIKLQLQFFKYLYSEVGVRTLVLEYGPSVGWLVDTYIQKGDSVYFDSFKKYTNLNTRDFYIQLRNFNAILPVGQKINVIGIDKEDEGGAVVKYLNYLLPTGKEIPKSLELNVKSLQALMFEVDDYFVKVYANKHKFSRHEADKFYQAISLKATLDVINKDFNAKEVEYKNYLGDNFDRFKKILKGLALDNEWDKYQNANAYQGWIVREQNMYDNLKQFFVENPDAKIFGSFGRLHVNLNHVHEGYSPSYFESLIHRLNNSADTIFKNSVMSVGIFYPNSGEQNSDAGFSAFLQNCINISLGNDFTAFEVFSDSSNVNDMIQSFHYVIINNNEKENQIEFLYKKYNKYREASFCHFDISYGYEKLSISRLNGAISNSLGKGGFSEMVSLYSLALTQNDQVFSAGMFYNYIAQQSFILPNSDKYRLSGYTAGVVVGCSIVNTKYFSSVLSGGFMFGHLQLREFFYSQSIGVFNQLHQEVLYNNLIGGRVQFDNRVQFKYLSIGVKCGYDLDLSSKQWRDDSNKLIANSPSSGLNSFYILLNLSIMWEN